MLFCVDLAQRELLLRIYFLEILKNSQKSVFLPLFTIDCSVMEKIQRIMIDAGFTCPNRDGSRGRGGCSFCRTESFCPKYCHGSISEQLKAGKRFFAGKYPNMKYLAYFQPFSNTYAPLPVLKERYEEALSDPDVVGLVIATRPDCLPFETIEYLKELSGRTSLLVELGVESFYDRTLKRIGRGHDAHSSIDAIRRCSEAGLNVGIHLIAGLPGESIEDILHEADILNEQSIQSLKIHQLQILKGTRMADDWEKNRADFLSFTAESYADCIASFLARLKPSIKVERVASSAPSELLLHPRWGKKPQEIWQMVISSVQNEALSKSF